MSGYIHATTAKAVVKRWERMQPILPQGLRQLAGGTNDR
tara:strand:+ start:401 stop:517 length:117 start_codon:yes stop_codon:yes gene_type:complete